MFRFTGFIIILLLCGIFIPLSAGASEDEADLIMNTAEDYYKEGSINSAAEEYKKALHIYENKGDEKKAGLCCLRLGDVYFTGGHYYSAEKFYEKAYSIFISLPDENLAGEALIKKGENYLSLTSYEKSLAAYEEALNIYKKKGNITGKGIALDHMGDFYHELAIYEKALEYHKEALQCFKEEFETSLCAVTICKTGEDYFAAGEYDFGLEKLQEALDIAKYDPSVRYDILMRTGEICRDNGAYKLAYEMYKEAERSVSNGDVNDDGNKQKNAWIELARTRLLMVEKGDITQEDIDKQGDPLGIYEYWIKEGEESGDKKIVSMALFKSAEYCYKNRSPEEALKRYDKCLEKYESTGDRWGIIEVNGKIGQIYEGMEKWELAEKYYEASINELEKIRGNINSEELRNSIKEKGQLFYENLINLNIKRGDSKNAFYYLEQSRARALIAAMIASRVEVIEGDFPELISKDQELQDELNLIENQLCEEKSQTSENNASYIRVLEANKEDVEKKIDAVHEELIVKNPSYAFLTGIKKALTVDEVQERVLKDNQYIVEYFINDDKKITVWVISKSSFSSIELDVPIKELEAGINTFREPFEKLKDREGNFVDILSDLDMENLENLYNMVFKPVVSENAIPKNSEVIIVPDGILYSLPFECLVTGKGNTGSTGTIFGEFGNYSYLIEDYIISYSPSASALDPLLLKEKECSGAYMGVGNPSFESESPSEIAAAPQAGTDMLDLMRLQGYSLDSLPATEDEVKGIEELFKDKGETSIYLGPDATEENVCYKGKNYKYLLLATHGLLDEYKPMESALVFSYSSGPDKDGLLKAKEVLNMKLNADLVVLSACETGLGQVKEGEGVVGLTSSFMYAGAPSVVVSLWSVESASTAKLMEKFYINMINCGMNKTQALRDAKLTLMKESASLEGKNVSYSHPFFWAPFILIGNSN